MVKNANNLPDDVETLKALVRKYQFQAQSLQEQLNLLIAKRFGRSSEKADPRQLGLFNEAEAPESFDEVADEADTDATRVPAHSRKKPGRKPLPEYIERVEVLHDLPEAEKICPHDGHALERIGEAVSEQLDVVPARVQVLRHVRPKYACPCCRQGVQTAKLAPQPIPKSIASPRLLAHLCTAKYVDALPLHRQENILRRAGVELPRATTATWMLKLGELVLPLINLLRDTLLGYDCVQMDETRVQVLKEDGREAAAQSYMWLQRGGQPDKPVVLFDYDPSRAQAVPVRLLEGFTGYLQCDGYSGYRALAAEGNVRLVGCFTQRA